jgi:hypothetical protein
MKDYINGIIYGIKISIKLFAKLQDIKQGINILCKVQNTLKTRHFKDNISIGQYIQYEVLNVKK